MLKMKLLHLIKRAIGLTLFALLFSGFSLWAQNISIQGNVKDETGENLPGVNIFIMGTQIGVVTDENGNYTIEAPETGVLVFSFVGYKSQSIPIQGQNVINVVLGEDVVGLDEIVVVGYGFQKKSDITGSITSVDVSKIRDVPSPSIMRALQGKAAGLEIQNLSTRPGGSTQIRIRGNRSLSASNEPLIVVDGIPFGGTLNDISLDDIQSIEVLKDASATVIYGSRGSNGVIIITTKRGAIGDLRISYNGYQGITNVTRKYEVYNAEEFVRLRSAAGYTNYLPTEKESLLLGRETDWQDLIYQTGMSSNHEISLSAGTERTQYAFSGGYFSETGVLPEMGFTRYSMRVAVDQSIGRRIRVGFTSLNSASITDGQSANPMWALVSLSPLSTPYNMDGTVNEQPGYDTEETYNPLTLKDHERWKEQNRRYASFNMLYGEVTIIEGLKNRVNLGLDISDDKYNNFYGSNTPFRDGKLNSAQIKNSDNFSYTLENLLTYDKEFGMHRLNVTAMGSIQESTTISSRMDASNVPVNYLQYYNFSRAEDVFAPENDNNYTAWALASVMARVNYVYDDRYMLTVTGRADGSSRLAAGNKWHSYPALAVGWNIMNESFLRDVSAISNLKLRLGYGQTSNTAINPYSTLGGLSGSFYNFGDAGVRGYYVSSLPNFDLSWEFTNTINAGLDFGFLKGRITGSVDAYMQGTNNILLQKELPASQGVPGAYYENVGKTENRGLELILNGVVISPSSKDGFAWELNTNLFLNREKIVELQDPSITRDVGNGWFVGYPSSAIYDYVKLGIWQLDEADEAALYGAKPGDIKLEDFAGGGVNGDEPDGVITADDRRVLGSAQPDFQGGFTSTFRYKGFDLSVVTYFRVGGMIVSALHMPTDYVNRLAGRHNGIKVDYWTPDNPTNDMPQPNATIDASRTHVLGYFDGTFFKIRSINLGYDLNSKHLAFLGGNSSLRIFTSISDPFIFFSPYVKAGGVDPEPNAVNHETISGGEGVPQRALKIKLDTPPTRRIVLGVNFKF